VLVVGTRPFTKRQWLASLPMLLALGARWWSPQVAFLRADGRVQASVAWIILSAAMSSSGRSSSSNGRKLPTDEGDVKWSTVFLVWSMVFWFVVVWDVGIGSRVFIDRNAAPGPSGGDVLTWILTTWDAHPASKHLFLAWRTSADYAAKTAYENHSQAYLVWAYGVAKVLQKASALPLYAAINLLPFTYMLVAAGVMAFLIGREGRLRTLTPLRAVWLFIASGILITDWRFWHDLYSYSSDDPFPLVGALVVVLVAALRPPPLRSLALIGAGVLGALNPFVAPGVLLALLCVYGMRVDSIADPFDRKDLVWRMGALLTVGAVVFFVLPRVLIASHGYHTVGSTVAFRSGLDGDTQYFTSIWQAIVAPCTALCGGGRSLTMLLVPAFVPLAFAALLTIPDRDALAEQGRRLAFVAAPYLFSAILFPQAVSIHPYFYDHVLTMPVLIIGAAALLSSSVQSKMSGAVLLVALLLTAALLMSNLIAVTQSFPRT
jgi:hypothetical protein